MARKRKDGYYKKSLLYNGRRHYVYAKTKQEADIKLSELRQQLISGTYTKSENLSFEQYAKRWHESRKDIVSGETLKQDNYYLSLVSAAVIDNAGGTFAKLKVREIERQNIIDLQAYLKESKRDGGKPYSTRTINGAVSYVFQVLKTAKLERIIQWNPAEGIKPLKRTEPQARDTLHRALSEDETKRFFTAADTNWYYPLFLFMLSSGCRVGEAGALKETDIKGGNLYINATLTRTEEGYRVIGDATKTAAGKRLIPYTKAIQSAVEMQRAQNHIAFGNLTVLDKPIFRAAKGGILTESKVNENISRICKAAGVDRFTSHAFRDTFATRAIESGVNPKTLQEILGHSDFKMTMNLYAHVMEDTKEKEMKLIDLGLKQG